MFRCCYGLLVVCLVGTAFASEAEQPRPSFLILMADNWAWPHASCYGDPVVQTPTFDRLAREGMLFHQTFCLVPSCSPARAVFLTGQTIHRLGDAANLHGRFPAEIPVFTEALEQAGYQVGYSGKGWGPGNVAASGRTRNPAGKKYEDAAAFFKTADPDLPYCFWYSSRRPHLPWQKRTAIDQSPAPEKVRVPAYLPDVPVVRENIANYLGEVQAFDQECAELLEVVRQRSLLKNTVIIMTSDNGWQMPHGLAHVYDAGTRIPLAICWPGHVTPQSQVHSLVNFDDFAPTLLELAGLPRIPQGTGRSLVPLLLGKSDPSPREAVFLSRERHANVRQGDRSYPVRAIRTKEYLLVRNFEPDLWPSGDPELYFAVGPYGDVDSTDTKQFLISQQHVAEVAPFFQMNFAKRPSVELYDLKRDPDQTTNRASDPQLAEIQQQLEVQLANWMKETGDPRVNHPHDDRWDKAPYYGGRPKNPKTALE